MWPSKQEGIYATSSDCLLGCKLKDHSGSQPERDFGDRSASSSSSVRKNRRAPFRRISKSMTQGSKQAVKGPLRGPLANPADRAPAAALGAQSGDSGSIHGDSRPPELTPQLLARAGPDRTLSRIRSRSPIMTARANSSTTTLMIAH